MRTNKVETIKARERIPQSHKAKAIAVALVLGLPVFALVGTSPATAHAADAAYDNHVWLGAVYDGTSAQVHLLEVDVIVPTGLPDSFDSYFQVLSIWDDSNTLIQIALNAWLGEWQITYAALECDGTGLTQSGMGLTPGLYYHLAMEISGGWITYSVSRFGTTLWNSQWETGGSYFRMEKLSTCPGYASQPGLTLWEEIYKLHDQARPEWNLYFLNVEADSTTVSDWDEDIHGNFAGLAIEDQPDPLIIFGDGSEVGDGNEIGDVSIWNEWFALYSKYSPGWTQTQGVTYSSDETAMVLRLNADSEWSLDCTSDCDVDITAESWPNNWGINLDPATDTPEVDVGWEFSFPSNAPIGNYEVVFLTKRDGTAPYSLLRFVIHIEAPQPSTGSPGCIPEGTEILTPTGDVPVESLDPQDDVLAWDFTLNEHTTVDWAFEGQTLEAYGLDINDGELQIPGWGQRIYTQTEGGTGWVNDARDLQMGDLVFDAREGNWIEVGSITPLDSAEYLCGLYTSGVNNFIANGILVGGWTA
jgi:hypothetical protein